MTMMTVNRMHWGLPTCRDYPLQQSHPLQQFPLKAPLSPVYSLGMSHPQAMFSHKNLFGNSPTEFLERQGRLLQEFSPTAKDRGVVRISPTVNPPYYGSADKSPMERQMWPPPDESREQFRHFSPELQHSIQPVVKRKYRKRMKERQASPVSQQSPASVNNDEQDSNEQKCAGSVDLPDSTSPLQKRIYHCHDCQYVTDRKNNLKRHIATMHERCTKVLECCDTVFANKALLREHVRSCHSHGYDCKVCGRTFCRKALLKRHITVHSGQKDFVCGLCGYATSHKSNLDRHKRRHLPKHLRKPSFFTDVTNPYGTYHHQASNGMVYNPAAADPVVAHCARDLSALSQAASVAYPAAAAAAAHTSYFSQVSRGFRHLHNGKLHQVSSRPTKRLAGFQSRERKLLKKRFSSSYRKMMLMKLASSKEQSLVKNASPQNENTDPLPGSSKPSETLTVIPKKLKGLRLRLAPGLHRCKACGIVFDGQLDLSQHLNEEHDKEACLAPQRPLTLEMRPPHSRARQHSVWNELLG